MNELTPGLFDNEVHLVQASHGKRLANLIIDSIAYFIIFFAIGMLGAAVAPQAMINLQLASDENWLADKVVSTLLYGLTIGATEAVLKGKTPGKFITGTRAVRDDGKSFTTRDAFMRGLIKAIPLEAFSALGTPCYPWHDKWTKTMVVEESSIVVA